MAKDRRYSTGRLMGDTQPRRRPRRKCICCGGEVKGSRRLRRCKTCSAARRRQENGLDHDEVEALLNRLVAAECNPAYLKPRKVLLW